MNTYCIAQGTLLKALGDLNGKGVYIPPLFWINSLE